MKYLNNIIEQDHSYAIKFSKNENIVPYNQRHRSGGYLKRKPKKINFSDFLV